MEQGIAMRMGRPQMRAARRTGFTKARQTRFIDHLAATCNVLASARAAGVTARNAYALRQNDPVFAARWATAIETAYEVLEAALLARALGSDGATDGELPQPDPSRAQPAAFDPDLALRLLSRYDPTRHGRPSGGRRTGRTTYKRVTVEEVEASLMAKLDALERVTATGGPGGEAPHHGTIRDDESLGDVAA